MQAGKLRHKLLIQSHSETLTKGKIVHSWTDYCYVWGHVEAAPAAESVVNNAQPAIQPFTVTLRYHLPLTSTHRFVWDGRVLEIVGQPVPDARKRVITIQCRSTEGQTPELTAQGTGKLGVKNG